MIRTFMRALLCSLIVACLLPLHAQTVKSPTLVSRARIHFTPENADRLPLSGIDLTHGKSVPGRHFTTDLTSTEIEHIKSLGFEVEVLIEDVIQHYKTQQPQRNALECQEYEYNYPIPENFTEGSMGGYLTYSEILDALDLMQLLYPQLISTRAPAGNEMTHQGRQIYWVRISDNATQNEAEPEILYTGLHHAREPMSMMQMIYYMWYLLEGYGKDPEATYLINNTELYFIPCVNPDGYIYNQMQHPDGGGMWRKNMRDNDEDGEFDEKEDGVDINRNYGYKWGYDDIGSSPNASSQTYRGPSAFSEPETRAVKEFVDAHNIQVSLNYHSYGDFFIYPWGYTEDPNPEEFLFENYGELLALDNGFKPGTCYETVGYPTNGSSDDWMYGDVGIYAMTPEIGEDDFWPSQTDIIPISQACLKSNLALAHLPHRYAVATELTSAFFTDHEGTIDIRVKSYGLNFGDMALTVLSYSPNLEVSGDIVEVSLGAFEDDVFSIPYTLDASAQGGDEFTFVIILDNGFFETRDTVTKTLAGETLVFSEDGVDLQEWTTEGFEWNITDEDAHNGATSLTDSPDGTYTPNIENIIQISETIDLTNALHAVMEFWTRWEIEEYIDYAQVQISVDGVNFEALCGQYSKQGSIFQLPEPLYDGLQEEWVKESIDLSAYVGNEVYIRFVLVSDSYLEMDGIYLDDIRIYVYELGPTGISDPEADGDLRIWPNPAATQFWIADANASSTGLSKWISIHNSLGAQIAAFQLDPGAGASRVNTEAWPAGLYMVHLFEGDVVTGSRKIVIE